MATKKTEKNESPKQGKSKRATGATKAVKKPSATTAKAKADNPEKPGRAKPRAVKPEVRTPTKQEIAQRAYEIWEAKGRLEGTESGNWEQAERELGGQP